MSTNKWWNTRQSKLILKLDYAYIEPLVSNYSGDNCVINKGEFVADSFQPKPEFTCELCGSGSKKRQWRPACFFPTEVGYIYKCSHCHESLTLYQYLLNRNPDVAKKYQMERWIKKVTGSSYNCPHPPKNHKREYYQRLERERKELNKRLYEMNN